MYACTYHICILQQALKGCVSNWFWVETSLQGSERLNWQVSLFCWRHDKDGYTLYVQHCCNKFSGCRDHSHFIVVVLILLISINTHIYRTHHGHLAYTGHQSIFTLPVATYKVLSYTWLHLKYHNYTMKNLRPKKAGTRTQNRKMNHRTQPWIALTKSLKLTQGALWQYCETQRRWDQGCGGAVFFSLKCLSMKKSGARIWIEWNMNVILDCLALNVWLKRNMFTTCHGYGILLVWSYQTNRGDGCPFCKV